MFHKFPMFNGCFSYDKSAPGPSTQYFGPLGASLRLSGTVNAVPWHGAIGWGFLGDLLDRW